MIKALLIFAVLALPACEKPNDLGRLQANARSVASEYQPVIDALHQREQQLIEQGRRVPPSSAGVAEARARMMDADRRISELQHEIGRKPGGGCQLVDQADALAKAGKRDQLDALVASTRAKLEEGVTVATDDLEAVETWVWYAVNAPPAPAPAPTPTP